MSEGDDYWTKYESDFDYWTKYESDFVLRTFKRVMMREMAGIDEARGSNEDRILLHFARQTAMLRMEIMELKGWSFDKLMEWTLAKVDKKLQVIEKAVRDDGGNDVVHEQDQ